MALQLGDTVPDFTQDSQLGQINLYDFGRPFVGIALRIAQDKRSRGDACQFEHDVLAQFDRHPRR